MTEDEAFAAFDFIGDFAGDDDEVDITELGDAWTAAEALSEEQIAEIVDGASKIEA